MRGRAWLLYHQRHCHWAAGPVANSGARATRPPALHTLPSAEEAADDWGLAGGGGGGSRERERERERETIAKNTTGASITKPDAGGAGKSPMHEAPYSPRIEQMIRRGKSKGNVTPCHEGALTPRVPP
jgi:hypothetical protein